MKTSFKTFSISLMLICGATASAQQLKGYDKDNMNLDVKPGDNFVEYACGNWLKTHPLRDDQMTNGAFMDLYARCRKTITKTSPPTSRPASLRPTTTTSASCSSSIRT